MEQNPRRVQESDGTTSGPASGNPTGGLHESLGPEGVPQGARRVPKVRSVASLKASISCDVTNGTRKLWVHRDQLWNLLLVGD